MPGTNTVDQRPDRLTEAPSGYDSWPGRPNLPLPVLDADRGLLLSEKS